MYLEDILGSKTKLRLLSALFKKEGETFFEKELAQSCGASISETNRQIGTLVEFGLVHYKKVGRLKTYCVNRTHFLYSPLKRLFEMAEE